MIAINGKTHIFIYICFSMIFAISGDIVSKAGRNTLQSGTIVFFVYSQKTWAAEVYTKIPHCYR
jgi:hypothetical protein